VEHAEQLAHWYKLLWLSGAQLKESYYELLALQAASGFLLPSYNNSFSGLTASLVLAPGQASADSERLRV